LANGFSLDELTSAVHDAVINASEIGEHAALARIQQEDHWIAVLGEDGNQVLDKDGNPVYKPRMVTLRMPTWVDGKLVEQEYQVPVSTLTSNRQLYLEKLKLKMSVHLDGLEQLAEVGEVRRKLRVTTNSGGFFGRKSGNIAELEITFSGQDASEGAVRIDNQLIKLIP